jgi:two-component system, OmpR family, sensor kinase
MRRLSNLPIRWRLTVLYGSILSLILVVFASGVYYYFENSLQASIDAKIKSMGEVISSSLTDVRDPSLFGNFERYLENVLGRKPKGKFIQIIDSAGRIGARMNDIEAQSLPSSFNTLERALSGQTVYETIERVKPRLRMVTIPIMDENRKVTSIVQVGTSLEDFDETMKRLLIIMIIAIPTSIASTIAIGYAAARKALKPVDKMRKTAFKITSRNLGERIDIGRRRDELGKLAQTFNEMIDRLQDGFQRINQFSSDVSHELKTPLTIIKGETEVALRKERTVDEYKTILESHLEEVDQMTRIIEDLLLLSKADKGEMRMSVENMDARDLIMNVYSDMRLLSQQKGVHLVAETMADTKLRGDELKLRRMLRNIVDNGIKYTQAGGTVEISSRTNDGFITMEVRDTGIGIAKEDLRYIFDRFYRADRARKRESGSGLGLSISKWIVEAHGGTIEVESQASSGSLFVIRLPLGGGAHDA